MATAATAAGALRASCPPSALEPTPDPGPRVPTAKGRVGDNVQLLVARTSTPRLVSHRGSSVSSARSAGMWLWRQ